MSTNDIFLGISAVLSVIAVLACLALAVEISSLRADFARFAGPRRLPDSPTAVELFTMDGPARLVPDADAILLAALPGCSACDKLLSSPIPSDIRELPFAVVIVGERPDANELARKTGVEPGLVVADRGGVLLRAGGVATFPSGLLIENGQFVRSLPVSSWGDLSALAGSLRPTPLRLAWPIGHAHASRA